MAFSHNLHNLVRYTHIALTATYLFIITIYYGKYACTVHIIMWITGLFTVLQGHSIVTNSTPQQFE